MLPVNFQDLQAYKSTPIFTEDTVPAGLLADHSTKEGVWGLIHVTQGKLRYRVTDPRRASEEQILGPDGEPGVVEPTILHKVEPIGPVQFYVEFLRDPTARSSSAINPNKETKS